MGEKTTGQHTGITISAEDGYGEKVAKGLPVVGGAVKAVDGVLDDGTVSSSDTRGFMADSASFIQSCTDAVSKFATDPIGWLVGQGLGFLFTLIQPLQDMVHAVSGDGPALANAAGNFSNIGKGLEKFASELPDEAKEKLSAWHGEASDAAHTRLNQFARGVNGIASEAGNIAQLLQASSMIMTVIEEFIKALITEFVSFLIWIWIPALASAVISFGASTAAAMGLSVGRGVQVGARATRQVGRLQKLLDMLKDLLAQLKAFLRQYQPMLESASGAIGKREARGFVGSMVDAGLGSLKDQAKPGRIPGHLNNAGKIVDSGFVGDGQSEVQTREDLDF